MSAAPGAYRYLTLSAARALKCNGCGDCCDSRRSDGYWRWGLLPPDQYADSCGGKPLIIPLAVVGGSWQDRDYRADDSHWLSGTCFRCTAFEPRADGGGDCGRHDQTRPSACGDFPVGGAAIEDELSALGSVLLESAAFPRCTWYRVVVLRDGDPRLAADPLSR